MHTYYILTAKPSELKNELNAVALHFIKFIKRSRNLAVTETALNV